MIEKVTDLRVKKAARNNATWCDTLCRAHGVPGEFHDTLWINRYPVPRFYPNLVTLTSDAIAAQLKNIQTLVTADLPGNWGVKDSFRSLDLTALGFGPAFEAMWLWRTPSQPLSKRADSDIRWTFIQTAPELSKWETAWSGDLVNKPHDPEPRLFLPTLLSNTDLNFIAAYHNESIVAGAIANRTDDVVGLSNVFTPPDNPQAFWADCVAKTRELFPTLPIVGYERGSQLAIAQEIGFETLQPLKVWTRQV
jgi:hypothetical protein